MEEKKARVVTFSSAQDAIDRLATLKETSVDEKKEKKLSRMEILQLMSILRSPTKPMVLVTRPDKIEALHNLLSSVVIEGNVVEYHGEIFDNISVFTSEQFPPGCFRMIPREELSSWIMQKQLPF